MKPIGHQMILASAGSGKTYALTNRFVRLLALGAAPERIVALTFTRKAAGEFFDEILNKLARAASDPVYARKLADEIGFDGAKDRSAGASANKRDDDSGSPTQRGRGKDEPAGAPDFLKLLRAMADAMHRLRLGTFDGFFARVARNFPLELGLTGEFELLEEHAAQIERGRVLRRMFERSGELAESQREFIEAFKRATFGAEEKRLGVQLDAFLDQYQDVFLSAPLRVTWGNPQRIWRDGARWLVAGTDVRAASDALRAWTAAAPIGDKQRLRWQEFLDACAAWTPGVVPSRPLAYVLGKVLDAWPAIEAGRAVLEFDRKKQGLNADACAALAELARHVIGGELRRRLEMTCGIYAVLAAYETVYHDVVRRAGKLTFADAQRLLLPVEGAPMLSSRAARDTRWERQDAGSGLGEEAEQGLLPLDLPDAATQSDLGDRRLLIDYRLDGEIDHWLLDEFQDTSFGQWSVLRNLIDEAVQDPTGARSFFYVGDVKQAIFAWRDGDPRLFREIFNHYNAMRPGAIAEEHLVNSWRSGPAVIAAVNRVFGDAAVLGEMFPGEASRLWNREWRAHASAKPALRGHVALLQAGEPGNPSAKDEAARFAAALALLQELRPLERGLDCALLVQKNSTAAALADYLRREGGLPAVAESDLHVCTDNPLGAALLALAKTAAHPGDTLAWEHVQMTPLARVLAAERLVAPEDVTRRLLEEIHSDGFERAMAGWARRLEPALAADDAFSRERARQFVAAAGLFDATGSRDVAEFIAFMERHAVRDVESAAVIRVMTIHKAKGLGFDVVILPDLEGQKLDCRRDGLALQRAQDRTVEWVLDLPGKLFHACDEVLSGHVRAAEADACYEALSLLYVAMTRAKRALYLIVKPPGGSTSRNFTRLLAETLGDESAPIRVGARDFAGAYSDGDPEWHCALQRPTDGAGPKSGEAVRELAALPMDKVARVPRLVARRPSAAKAAEWLGPQLFAMERTKSAEFGTAVHRLLAEVEWGSAGEVRRLAKEWAARGEEAGAIEEALACLQEPALADVWTARPSAEVWRERPFEIVLEGAWITGVFDRVVVERDENGQVKRATVFDFKTDRPGPGMGVVALARRHAAQLNLYRRVAAVLAELPLTSIACEAVFTRLRRTVAVALE